MLNNMNMAKAASIQALQPARNTQTETKTTPTTLNFHEILGKQLETPIHFSKHAAIRLNDRNINLTGEQIERVADGVGKANEKGIRDSLVLVDDIALVVNIKSRTVITAIAQASENVYSNIDGAVIV